MYRINAIASFVVYAAFMSTLNLHDLEAFRHKRTDNGFIMLLEL